ncbi:hypothetical protein D9M70_399760 [compost metagenome]
MDRSATEMSEVGVERLGTRHRQENGAKDDDADIAFIQHEAHGIVRIEGLEDRQVVGNVDEADPAHHQEPDQRDRPEEVGDGRRSLGLHRKQHEQDDHRDRNHVFR